MELGKRDIVGWAAILALVAGTSALAQDTRTDTRLIVQITVDGLRGDLLSRYWDSFGDGGFRRLIGNGVWYTDAHHAHANTETVVGHATLATGAHPSVHGMTGNAWLLKDTGTLGYSVQDPDYGMIPLPGFDGSIEQVDPAQAAAQVDGRSPKGLLSSTFSDELWKARAGASKIVSISGKDRSAIMLGGQFGKAFWMSARTGGFETSTFYYDAYPQWVLDWNNERKADAGIGGIWRLTDPMDTYLFIDHDDRAYEVDLRGFGRTFPHEFGPPEDGLYYTQVLISPLGDEVTADFAKAAVLAEELGQDDVPDFLSVSFAGVDGTQHFFGPSSLESEDLVRSLDKTLAGFLTFMDETIGAGRVLYVLSADHGMPEMPEYMAENSMETHRTYNNDLLDDLNAAVEAEFGLTNAFQEFFRPYLYFDEEAIADADRRALERFAVGWLTSRPGIAVAVPRAPLPEHLGQDVLTQIQNNFHPIRSGDIYVAQARYSFLYDEGPIGVMHGSPWRYDTHVPIIFSGPGIAPARIDRRVETVDVAVTLANIFGTSQPSGASGVVLTEVTGQ